MIYCMLYVIAFSNVDIRFVHIHLIFHQANNLHRVFQHKDYRQPNKIMAYLTFRKLLVSVCNIHNDIMDGTSQNQSLGKSELCLYFIRLMFCSLRFLLIEKISLSLFWRKKWREVWQGSDDEQHHYKQQIGNVLTLEKVAYIFIVCQDTIHIFYTCRTYIFFGLHFY